ncbi:hypothetical protein QTP86_024588 [Hemibagrus guttatus]|nr:hypothetical protein QTP86_024588 [Hemibagrus guttatus]
MVLDSVQSNNILSVFPHFKDIKCLIDQDFGLMFEGGGKLLEKWSTTFKKKVIQQCQNIPTTNDVQELLLATESLTDGSEEGH